MWKTSFIFWPESALVSKNIALFSCATAHHCSARDIYAIGSRKENWGFLPEKYQAEGHERPAQDNLRSLDRRRQYRSSHLYVRGWAANHSGTSVEESSGWGQKVEFPVFDLPFYKSFTVMQTVAPRCHDYDIRGQRVPQTGVHVPRAVKGRLSIRLQEPRSLSRWRSRDEARKTEVCFCHGPFRRAGNIHSKGSEPPPESDSSQSITRNTPRVCYLNKIMLAFTRHIPAF